MTLVALVSVFTSTPSHESDLTTFLESFSRKVENIRSPPSSKSIRASAGSKEERKLSRGVLISELADRAQQFDAGWTSTDDNEGEPGTSFFGVVDTLSRFEGNPDSFTNFGGVLNGLES